MVSGIACDAMKTLRAENEIGLEARLLGRTDIKNIWRNKKKFDKGKHDL